MMQPIMREMMNRLMKVTPDHDNDPTYKEVQDFMVPTSSGKPFVDAPGTFHLHEQFCRGREGFKAHLAAPNFQPWQAFVDSEPFTDGLISASYYPGPRAPS